MAVINHTPSALRCGVFIMGIKLALGVVGFERTVRWICVRAGHGRPSVNPDDSMIATVAEAVAVAGALYPGRALCLEQSLTLYYYLRRVGIAARLCFGVRPHPFEAHAWVEHRDHPVNDLPEHVRHYLRLPELPL